MKPRAFKVCVKHPEVTHDPRTIVFTSCLASAKWRSQHWEKWEPGLTLCLFSTSTSTQKLLKLMHSCRFTSDESACSDKWEIKQKIPEVFYFWHQAEVGILFTAISLNPLNRGSPSVEKATCGTRVVWGWGWLTTNTEKNDGRKVTWQTSYLLQCTLCYVLVMFPNRFPTQDVPQSSVYNPPFSSSVWKRGSLLVQQAVLVCTAGLFRVINTIWHILSLQPYSGMWGQYPQSALPTLSKTPLVSIYALGDQKFHLWLL